MQESRVKEQEIRNKNIMNRIDKLFKEKKNNVLSVYFTAGYPALDDTVKVIQALEKRGVYMLEIGVPFSDPMADGPVIQRSSERALAKGMSMRKVLAIVAEFRKSNATTPVVLMGYANPVEALGQQAFVSAAADAGVDGVLVVDYPPEEADDFADMLSARDLSPIFCLRLPVRQSVLRMWRD